jgi:hypothetical protein
MSEGSEPRAGQGRAPVGWADERVEIDEALRRGFDRNVARLVDSMLAASA